MAVHRVVGGTWAFILVSAFALLVSAAVGAPGAVAQESPQLTLDPNMGPPGTSVTAEATGHDCPSRTTPPVVFLWHGEVEVGRSFVNDEGIASATFPVPDAPELASLGSHDLLARCEFDGYEWPLAFFTVTSPVAGSTEPPEESPPEPPIEPPETPTEPTLWWPIATALAILLGAALFATRAVEARDRRWVRAHVRAAPGAAAGRRPEVAEYPVDSSRPTFAVRIEPHADSGTQVLEEVDQ